jgi:hypothetical protein
MVGVPSDSSRRPESAIVPPALIGLLLLLVVVLAIAFVLAAQLVQTP